jgi:hypothetical protein
MFEKKNADTLHKHWPYNCNINLEEGAQLPFGPIYNFSQDQLVAFCEYINQNLEKRFIWHSKFTTSALILFVKKKDGTLQMCVDYHELRLLDQLSHAKVYSNINLCETYNLVCIRKGN